MKICPACSREYPSERTHCERDGVGLVALATGAGARAEDLIGRVVDGRYQVEAIIGKGGMGTVYACRHVVVGKPFAMKVLRQGVEQTGDVLQRFIREAQTANSVRSRHIVEMTDFGQLPSGQFYVTMELLEGMDLGKALKSGLGRDQLVHVFVQCADVLELTHQRGIVHRDLKPDNIFLVTEEGDPLFVKLLDFGIAKALNAGPSGLTETGVVLGTPYYMSPEQARGEEVDARTDIYSLGVIMYRAFTGKLPFMADSAVGVLTRHLTEAPQPPSRVSGVEPAIEQVILCCLEKRRESRFQSMRAVADALRAVRAAPRPLSMSGSGPSAALPSGAYAAGQPGVHNAPSGAVTVGARAVSSPGVPGASGQYAAALSGPSGQYAAALSGPSGQYAAASGAHVAVPPATSGPHAAAIPNASGQYGAAPPSVSGQYGAAIPNASGPYGAAPPSVSGQYGAAIPNASGPYGAAGSGASGPHAALRTGAHAAAPASSGAFPPAPGGAYTSGPSGVHNGPPSMGGPGSMGAPGAEWTSHGLATSQGLRLPPPKRRWPLLVGAVAMLGLGGVIAVTLGSLGRTVETGAAGSGDPGGAITASATGSAAPSATSTSTATAAGEAPTASASAAPTSAASASAEPIPTAVASAPTKPTGKIPTASTTGAKTTPTATTKRPPEIRSPFD